MRNDLGLRLSSYLTLGLACVCLGYAEQMFLPGIAVFVAPVLVLLAAAFFAEGRWYLPVWAANLLGLAIAAGSGLWITICLVWPGPPLLDGLPMPIALLPYLGPLLAILLVAKLFRPKKAGDIWLLQGMGLLQVALGCVLANGLLFGLLLLAYLACGIWFLAMFHVQRELAGRFAGARHDLRPPPSPYPVGRWTLTVTAAGVILFLLIPRFGATQWSFLGALTGAFPDGWAAQTGVSDLIDLNRVGTVQVNNEVALVVFAEDGRGPKLDLSPQQRWRVVVLDHYRQGQWQSAHFRYRQGESEPGTEIRFRRWGQPPGGPPPWHFPREENSLPLSESLPSLGPRQFFLNFAFDPDLVGGLVLAEPVVLHPGNPVVPVAPLPDWKWTEAEFLKNEGALAGTRRGGGEQASYRQVVVPLEEPDLSLPVRVIDSYQALLRSQRGNPLKGWTDQLLRDLAQRSASRLRMEDLQYSETSQGMFLRPEHHEKVARALCSHLATSGEYTYTLELRRHDPRLDPTEDFLRHLKQGHCERYAGALVLMLRSQGIPARVVKGFRGGEHLGNGQYALRHSDAHSWVEALVPRSQPDGTFETHWLTLDPTPSIEAPSPPPFSAAWWWDRGNDWSRAAWKEFVVEYDIDQQAVLREEVGRIVGGWDWGAVGERAARLAPWLALGPLVLAGFWLGRRYLSGRPRPAGVRLPEAGFYARLLAILARGCQLCPVPAQTPREFGEAARRVLRDIPAAACLAEVPARAADLLYRVRYGRQALSADEEQDMNQRLDQLDVALGEKASAGRS